MKSCWSPRMRLQLAMLSVGATVLLGCQKTVVDASKGPMDVENSTAATVPETVPAVQESPSVTPTTVQAVREKTSAPVGPPPARAPQQVPASTQSSSVVANTVSTQSMAPQPRPVLVTVPSRTILVVELQKTLSSHTSQVGESFHALLAQDVAVDGRTALPAGSLVQGRVTEAKPAKKVGGRARLSLEFTSVQLPDRRQVPIEVIFAEAGKSQTTKDAAIIGGSTLGGAVIGHAVNKGEGTAIGAIVGGLAGAAVANETRAKPVVVNSGTLLTLETIQSVTVEVAG